jgi:putative Mn2+ efflux pump MntP
LLSLVLLSLALGLDAFSLGIGVGMRGIRYLHVAAIAGSVGLFHTLLPLAGMGFGRWMHGRMGDWATGLSGLLLLLLGLSMLWQAWRGGGAEHKTWVPLVSFWAIMAFSFSVSVDSLTVGIGLGAIGAPPVLAVSLFGLFGAGLSLGGLLLGKKMKRWTAGWGDWAGGLVLFGMGLHTLVRAFMQIFC